MPFQITFPLSFETEWWQDDADIAAAVITPDYEDRGERIEMFDTGAT